MKSWLGLLICVFLGVMAMVPPSSAADAPAVVVGRVYAIEGDLLRYVPEESDWVAVARDAPFGEEDTLFSGSRGMAELVAPNGSWIRIGNSTQIQFIALEADLSELDVAAGMARFYNKSSSAVIKATSPFGYVLAYPGTVFDFYVGENSVEVVPVRGTVSFVHWETDARYDVSAGSPSILADQDQVSSGEGTVDAYWDRWNATRESFWASKSRVRGRSVQYLPPALHDESYALEENGRWESVYYEGSSRWFWRPTTVTVGWSPFTMGRWTDWGGDQCWIPNEPFGYVTHHYGNWIYARNAWYWAPPVASVRVGLPLLNLGFFWYPGRVSWIHSGAYVGWVPLAPRETYYSRRHWGGPHTVVVANVNIGQINIRVGSYSNANHAVVVNQNNFYRVNNYRDVRVTNINSTTIINNYRAAPVVNNTVINNYTTNKQRFNYTNATVNEKPHSAVIERIRRNETAIRGGRKENAVVVEQQVKKLPEGRINREARIEQPKSTNYIVPANEVNRPKAEIKLQQREIKGDGRATSRVPPTETVTPEQQPTRPDQPGTTRPERLAPRQPKQPTATPERAISPKPSEAPQAAPERVEPARPRQPEKRPAQPAARPERERVAPPRSGQPSQPGQTERPGAQPERAISPKPSEAPQAAPERVEPARPRQPEKRPAQPAARPERAAPAKPAATGTEPGQPAAKPERVRPGRPEQSTGKPEQIAPARPATRATNPGQPTPRPEQVKPKERPEQGPQPARPARKPARPERVAPAKEGNPDKSEDEPEQQEKQR